MEDRLMETWKRAGSETPPLSREALGRILGSAATRTSRALAGVLWSYVALLGVTLVLALANLPLFGGNLGMQLVEGGLALAAAASAAFGIALALRVRRLRRDLPLLEAVERGLALYRGPFQVWLLVASTTPWLLTLAINTRIDAQDGTYRIDHPLEFALVTGLMLGFTYVMLRVSLASTAFEMRATLHDLHAQALEATSAVAEVRRRTRTWMALGVVLLILGVLAGLWLWWRAA